MNRNIEDDLKGLIKFFKKCFTRNNEDVPKYSGQLIESNTFDDYSIKASLNPKSEAYKYHLERGRDLSVILLSCAYQLGFDCCYVKELKPLNRFIKMTNAGNSDIIKSIRKSQQSFTFSDTEDGIAVGLIDAIITISNVLSKMDLNSMETRDALKDLKSNDNLKNLLKPD